MVTDGSDIPPQPSDIPPDLAADRLRDLPPVSPDNLSLDSQPETLPATVEPAASSGTATDQSIVLANGHLHPAILLLRLIDALRQVAFPVMLGIAAYEWFLVGALVLFVLQLGVSVIRYLTLEYTLTTDELRIREGLLHRQERRIPLDRIQDLGFESTLLRRALGLSVVMVETASGRGVEAKLDALSRRDAEHLREVLLAARLSSIEDSRRSTPDASALTEDGLATGPGQPKVPATPEIEWLVHRSTAWELVVRGATDMRLGAFAVSAYAAYEVTNQLGMVTQLAGIANSFREWLYSFSPIIILSVLAGLLFVVMAFGIITSTIGNLVQFHGFQIVLRGDVLQRRYGLLTTRQKTLLRARVQRVTIEQTWLRRLCGYAVVKADSAGSSRSDGQDTSGGWDVVVPLTSNTTARALLPSLLPGIEKTQFEWHRGSPKLIARTAMQGVLLSGIGIAAFWWRAEFLSLFALLLIPLWTIMGVLVWRNLGWARGTEFFALQHGIIGKNFACVPTAKIQAVVVRQTIVGQILGVADLTVYVAGGSPTRIPDLTLHDARMLCLDLSERASAAAARDW